MTDWTFTSLNAHIKGVISWAEIKSWPLICNYRYEEMWAVTVKWELQKQGEKLCPVSPCSSVHTWLNETKAWRNTVIIIIIEEKGDRFLTCSTHLTATVIWAFPVRAASMANEFMKPFTERSSVALLLGLGALTGPCSGLGPHLDYEWESSNGAGTLRLAPIHIQAAASDLKLQLQLLQRTNADHLVTDRPQCAKISSSLNFPCRWNISLLSSLPSLSFTTAPFLFWLGPFIDYKIM